MMGKYPLKSVRSFVHNILMVYPPVIENAMKYTALRVPEDLFCRGWLLCTRGR
jgi:hypothetical protein